MRKHRVTKYGLVIILVFIKLQACSSIQQAPQKSPTPPFTENPTLTPTTTPKPPTTPTATPNTVATQQYETFFSLIQKYSDSGYIPSKAGSYHLLDNYSNSYAKDGYLQWSTLEMNVENFVIKTQITMSTANNASIRTGCGMEFRESRDNVLQTVIIQQNGKASFFQNGYKLTAQYFGKITNPEEFIFVLIANGPNLHLFIDSKQALVFEIPKSVKTLPGNLGFAVMSGSNEDFGSRCDFKNTQLWVIN